MLYVLVSVVFCAINGYDGTGILGYSLIQGGVREERQNYPVELWVAHPELGNVTILNKENTERK